MTKPVDVSSHMQSSISDDKIAFDWAVSKRKTQFGLQSFECQKIGIDNYQDDEAGLDIVGMVVVVMIWLTDSTNVDQKGVSGYVCVHVL